MSFLDLVTDLLANPAAKDAYNADPQGWLSERGFGDLDASQLQRAMGHSSDALAPDVARTLGPNPSLDDAASIDMEASGISLDRPGFDDDVEGDLDADPYATDVDLDTDEASAEAVEESQAFDTAGGSAEDTAGDSAEEADSAPANEFTSETNDADLLDTTNASADPADAALDETPFSLDADYGAELDADPEDVDDSFDGLD